MLGSCFADSRASCTLRLAMAEQELALHKCIKDKLERNLHRYWITLERTSGEEGALSDVERMTATRACSFI